MTRPRILFLHGALGAASGFKSLITLCEPYFNCEAFEFPGHGESASQDDFSINGFTKFLIEKAELSDGPLNIFGYSMGGYIALNALTQRPDCFSAVMTLGTKFDWHPAEGAKQIAMLNVEKIAAKIPHYAAHLAQLHKAHRWQDVVGNTCTLLRQLSENPPLDTAKLSQIDIPVCVGIGDHDQMVSLEETARVYRVCQKGSLYVIPGMQHPLEKINADLVKANMLDFFSGK